MVLSFAFSFLIHVEFIPVYGVKERYNFIFPCSLYLVMCTCHPYPPLFHQFHQLICFQSLNKTSLLLQFKRIFWITQRTNFLLTVFFFKNFLAILAHFLFQMNLRICLSSSIKNPVGILIGIAWKLQINWGRIDIFTILSLPTQEHGMFFFIQVFFDII